jgi:hypothetical protein
MYSCRLSLNHRTTNEDEARVELSEFHEES